MDRRNQPTATFWGESMNFWSRLWQLQIESSVRFWGAMASQLPRPTSAQLAAEAESIRKIQATATRKAADAANTATPKTEMGRATATAEATPV